MFNTEKEMLDFLRGYRNAYYEWLYLETSTNVRSPVFSQTSKTTRTCNVSGLYNLDIERKQELEEYMKNVEELIKSLKTLNQDYYRIMYFKFIRFETFEKIAQIIHSSKRTTYRLYAEAKIELLKKTKGE